MKKIIFIIVLILPIALQSQVYIDSLNNNEIKFKQVYDVELKNDRIRNLVNKWININFKDSKTVIKIDNKKNIVLKGTYSDSSPMGTFMLETLIDYILDISYKDNKYKVEFYELKTYHKNYKKFSKAYTSNNETFDSYNKIRKENSIEENMESYKKATKFSSVRLSHVKTFLVNAAENLNKYIKNNLKENDW